MPPYPIAELHPKIKISRALEIYLDCFEFDKLDDSKRVEVGNQMRNDRATLATESWEALRDAGPYNVIVADPPWDHYGAPDKWAAAAKFYSLMTDAELAQMPVSRLLAAKAVLFMWCTSSSLARAIDLLDHWGVHYRGVAFVWCKTAQNGRPIGAQGVRPSITKPLTEFVIAGATQPRGRPLPLASESIRQTVFAPRGAHSEKPEGVQAAIEEMYPAMPKAELFARRPRSGWACWGNELPAPPKMRVSAYA